MEYLKAECWLDTIQTGIKKILEEIKKHKTLDFPVDEVFQVYTNHPIIFTTQYDTKIWIN